MYQKRFNITMKIIPHSFFLIILLLSVVVMPRPVANVPAMKTQLKHPPQRRHRHINHSNLTSLHNETRQENCVNIRGTAPLRSLRIPYHTHIRKSGGSMICALALLSTPGKFFSVKEVKERNCNMQGDGPKTMAAKKGSKHAFANRHLCCADRYQAARASQRGLISRELYLDDFFCPEWFVYSVVLREPLSRMKSHLTFRIISGQM
jgi:hypothetical protein